MVAYFFAFMQLILNLFSSAHNLRQSQGFLLEMFLSKEDPLWQRAKGITTCAFPLTAPSWVPGLLCLPPQSCRMNFTGKKLRTWWGGGGRSVVSLTKSPPGCSVVILGFPRLWWIWCSDDFTSWLRHDEWITVFLRKSHFQEEPERMGEKSHMYGETFFMCDDVLTGWLTNYFFSRNVPQRSQYSVESLNSFNVDLK